MNRLLATKAALAHQIALTNKAKKRAATGALIQLGKIVEASGLLILCEIQSNETLSQNQLATLLGLLLDCNKIVQQQAPTTMQLMEWQRLGMLQLNANSGIKIYN